MPLVDMPLEELKKYQGITPCPDDFDQYWQKACDEMHAIDAQVELIPADFQVPNAECFDLYFTGMDNSRIHAKYVRPKNVQTPHPAVVEFHGYYGNAGSWNTKLNYVSQGFSIATMDVRGQAGYSDCLGAIRGSNYQGQIIRGLEDRPEKLLFRSIFLDALQLTEIVMRLPEVDPDRVGVFGMSQGGGLSIASAALNPRIRRVGIYYPFLSDYKRVWQMDLCKDAYLELANHFRQKDPTHEHEDEIFTKLGYIDVKNLAHRIRGEVMMACGLMDTIVPPSAQFAAYNRITSKKSLRIYPDYGHEPIPHYEDELFRFMLGL